jgi:hypothetical protein
LALCVALTIRILLEGGTCVAADKCIGMANTYSIAIANDDITIFIVPAMPLKNVKCFCIISICTLHIVLFLKSKFNIKTATLQLAGQWKCTFFIVYT